VRYLVSVSQESSHVGHRFRVRSPGEAIHLLQFLHIDLLRQTCNTGADNLVHVLSTYIDSVFTIFVILYVLQSFILHVLQSLFTY